MPTQLVPREILEKSERILFIAHLALGDFTYLQNCFKAFAEAYPHIEVHLWIDEVRRTADASQWPHLKKYALYDWVDACPFFAKVYNQTYSPELFEKSIREAQDQAYPIVVSLATLRPHQYVRLARKISPGGFVAGMQEKSGISGLLHRPAYRQLNATVQIYAASDGRHISDIYADWFWQLFGMQIPPERRFPFVDIPATWRGNARQALEKWGYSDAAGAIVFINPYAKTRKRCWPLERVAELIMAMAAHENWHDARFIINAMPQEVDAARRTLETYSLRHVHLFSADENFFQLPAMLACCDLIISVETAVMHLANAVHVPVIALMRQKNPEWVPVDRAHSTVITTKNRRDWVKAITVEQVTEALPARIRSGISQVS